MPDIEKLDISHGTYSKLIDAGITTTEQLQNKEDRFPPLEPHQVSEIALALRNLDTSASRSQLVMESEEVLRALSGLSRWEELVEATVAAYERLFVAPPEPDEDEEIKDAVKRIGGIMDKHGVGSHDD